MGHHSRRDNRPNPAKYFNVPYPALIQEMDTPQGKHQFAMLPLSFSLYWVTPQGPWRKVAEDAR